MSNLYEVDNYVVIRTDKCLNETGQANDAQGYAIVNKETAVVERTSLSLPDAMFTADSYNRMLTALLAEDTSDAVAAIEGMSEDVTAH